VVNSEIEADRTPRIKTGGDVLIRALRFTGTGKTLERPTFSAAARFRRYGHESTSRKWNQDYRRHWHVYYGGIIDTHSHFFGQRRCE
jgi:hypothetical protein